MKDLKGKNVFKDNLKMLRTEAGLGQVELAKRLGVGKATISYWENGVCEPIMSMLIKIADYFEISLDVLVGRED